MGSMLPYIAAPWIRHGYGYGSKPCYSKPQVIDGLAGCKPLPLKLSGFYRL